MIRQKTMLYIKDEYYSPIRKYEIIKFSAMLIMLKREFLSIIRRDRDKHDIKKNSDGITNDPKQQNIRFVLQN